MSETAAQEPLPEYDSYAPTDENIQRIDQALIKALQDQEKTEQDQEKAADPGQEDLEEDLDEETAELDLEEDPDEEGEADPDDGEADEITVDYDQAIPMPDGRDTMTVGQLKDAAIAYERKQTEIQKREVDLMREREELTNALAAVGGKVPPQLAQQMETRRQEELKRESGLMLEALPAWKDPNVYQEDIKRINEFMTPYGFKPEEIQAIGSAKVITFIVNAMNNAERLGKAEKRAGKIRKADKAPKGRKAPRKAKNETFEKLAARARATGSIEDQIAALDAIRG